MKALAVFPSSREVRLIEQPEPVIVGPTEVKLRILEAGVLKINSYPSQGNLLASIRILEPCRQRKIFLIGRRITLTHSTQSPINPAYGC